jgi:hypothetical protein
MIKFSKWKVPLPRRRASFTVNTCCPTMLRFPSGEPNRVEDPP